MRAALARLQGWEDLARSPQLSRFLGYIVEKTLAGEASSIKAYAIAIDVFGRPADFDPQSDPIVRVQARRLRGLLAEYYRGPGRDEPWRIELPIGRYVPEFVRHAAPAEPAPAEPAVEPAPAKDERGWRGPLLGAVIVMVAVGLVAVLLALTERGPPPPEAEPRVVAAMAPPSVTVVEFQNLTGDAGPANPVAGLAVELITDLELFEDLVLRYSDGAVDAAGSDFVLSGIARRSGSLVQYSAILTETATGSVVWSHAVERPATEAANAVDDISRRLSLLLGSSRGPLHAAARLRAAAGGLAAGESLYLCLMAFHLYRDTRSAGAGREAEACLAGLPQAMRAEPRAVAATASLLAEGGGPQTLTEGERLNAADAMMVEAMRQGAVSSFVWEQRARLYERMALPELARAAYSSALQLNPANGDAMAGFALMLALRGELDTAARLAETALGGTPQPVPAWYHGAPAITAYRGGDFERAVSHAAAFAGADRELGPVVVVLAALSAGRGDLVNRYLPQLLDVPSFRINGIIPQLRRRIGDPVLLADIRKGLIEAGVPSAALNRGYAAPSGAD